MERIRVEQQSHTQRCPLCMDAIDDEGIDRGICPGCNTLYHSDCLIEFKGCSTLGCERRGRAPRRALPQAATPQVTWGGPRMVEGRGGTGVPITVAFLACLLGLAGSAWELSKFSQSTVVVAIAVAAVTFFGAIVTWIRGTEWAGHASGVGTLWSGLQTIGVFLGIVTLFALLVLAPIGLLVFGQGTAPEGKVTAFFVATLGIGLTIAAITTAMRSLR